MCVLRFARFLSPAFWDIVISILPDLWPTTTGFFVRSCCKAYAFRLPFQSLVGVHCFAYPEVSNRVPYRLWCSLCIPLRTLEGGLELVGGIRPYMAPPRRAAVHLVYEPSPGYVPRPGPGRSRRLNGGVIPTSSVEIDKSVSE